MPQLPWEDPRLDPVRRREILEDSFQEFVNSPFWQMLQREASSRERHGEVLLRDPQFGGEMLKFYQGEVKAWSEVPDLPRRIYEQEDSLIELIQQRQADSQEADS